MAAPKFCERGFSLIEVLVTLIIVAVGLLGLGKTQMVLQQADMESYQRAQALVLANDMLDRISANRYAAPCCAFTTNVGGYLGDPGGGGHLADPTCGLGSATAEQVARASNDLRAWDVLLQGASETRAGANAGAMVGARGCVQFNAATSAYTVVVVWQGISETFAPVVACGNGLYGAESQRRAVAVTLRIARLL